MDMPDSVHLVSLWTWPHRRKPSSGSPPALPLSTRGLFTWSQQPCLFHYEPQNVFAKQHLPSSAQTSSQVHLAECMWLTHSFVYPTG